MPALPVPPNFAGPTDGDGAGNFPAGGHAWSGQPLRQAPPADYFTPGTGIAAEEVNYEFGTFADFIRTAYGLQVSAPALNWSELQIGGVAFATRAIITGAGWDDINKRWMVGAGDAAGTSTGDVYSNAGFGDVTDDWFSVDNGAGLTGHPFYDVVFDGTNFVGLVLATADSSAHVMKTVAGRTANWGSATLNDSLVAWSGARLYQFGGEIYSIHVSDDTLTHTMKIWRSVDHGATWLAALTSTTAGGDDVSVADNGTFMVVMGRNSSLGYYTGSLASWTFHANPFGGQVMQGLAFVGGVFVAITTRLYISTPGSGGETFVYQSSDGVTWTLVASLTSITLSTLACASGAGTLAALTADQGAGDGTGAVFCAFSVDFGVHWYRSQFVLPTEPSPPPLSIRGGMTILRGSPTGFFAGSLTTGRFSRNYGLPSAALS